MKVYDYGKTKNCLICGNIDGNFDRFIKTVVGSLRNLKSYVVETHPKEIERQERLAKKKEELEISYTRTSNNDKTFFIT